MVSRVTFCLWGAHAECPHTHVYYICEIRKWEIALGTAPVSLMCMVTVHMASVVIICMCVLQVACVLRSNQSCGHRHARVTAAPCSMHDVQRGTLEAMNHNMQTRLQDPVSLCPSALVKRYNISQQKELELQLAVQQDILQRYVMAIAVDLYMHTSH